MQAKGPAARQHELEELAAIYESRGLSKALAKQVATELTEKDVMRAHARDELGITLMSSPILCCLRIFFLHWCWHPIAGCSVHHQPCHAHWCWQQLQLSQLLGPWGLGWAAQTCSRGLPVSLEGAGLPWVPHMELVEHLGLVPKCRKLLQRPQAVPTCRKVSLIFFGAQQVQGPVTGSVACNVDVYMGFRLAGFHWRFGCSSQDLVRRSWAAHDEFKQLMNLYCAESDG